MLINNNHAIPWVLFIFFVSIYFTSTTGITNSLDAPQYALTQALVEDQSVQINKYSRYAYPDYSEYKGNIYSFRGVGESMLRVPFYFLAKLVQPYTLLPYNGRHIGVTQESKLEVITILSSATFGAGAVIIIYLLSLTLSKSNYASLFTAISYGIGSLLWRYSSVIQRFPLTSFFILLLLFILVKKKKLNFHYILFGIIAGLLFLTDNSLLSIILLLSICLIVLAIRQNRPKTISKLILFAIFFLATSSIFFLYNYLAFEKPFTHAYFYTSSVKKKWRDLNNFTLTPLYPSIFINLFSNAPIPKSAFSPDIWNNPKFRVEESIEWATKTHYKGIFTQSPYLYFALGGIILLLKRKKRRTIAIIIASTFIILLIQLSRFTLFFGPNAYDSHYFIPAVTVLTIGLSPMITEGFKKKSLTKILFIIILTITTIVSIYNGWYSNITNFNPHVTGEHRFALNQLSKPLFSQQNISNNIWTLFINTFPNIYNIHILIFIYFPLCFLIYLLIINKNYLHKYINNPIKKLDQIISS